MFGSIKTNSGAIALLVRFIQASERCHPNLIAHQTSGQRPLKRWVSVRFQTNSGAVRIKYERNMAQILLNEPKTRSNDKMRHDFTKGTSGVS